MQLFEIQARRFYFTPKNEQRGSARKVKVERTFTNGIIFLFFVLSLILSFTTALAATIHVPIDQPTIQAGIDAASDGDAVLVADETYTGAGNKNLDLKGKEITVQSENGPENCIIDCEGDGRGFYFHSGEGATSKISGFTITNGSVNHGGGIYCEDSSPTISNCTILSNKGSFCGGGIFCKNSSPTISSCTISNNFGSFASYGGGIYCDEGSSPTISKCIITGNRAIEYGGGISCRHTSSPTITNCIISGNTANGGGGIFSSNSSPVLINCTISYNTGAAGGGMLCSSSPVITNCISWANSPDEIYVFDSSIPGTPFVTYSDIKGGYSGEGNIDADPLFADPLSGNYHITTGSPCIDAGNNNHSELPDTDFEGDARIIDGDSNGTSIVDMGADEHLQQVDPPVSPWAWPMFQHDQGHTGQSDYVGPQIDNVEWIFSFSTGTNLPPPIPAIGKNGIIYAHDSAIKKDGSLEWRFNANVFHGAAVSNDGTIYCQYGNIALYAINPDGSEKWKFDPGTNLGYSTMPAVLGSDGTIYCTFAFWDGSELSSKLYAINPDGSEKWSYQIAETFLSSPAIGNSSILYVSGSNHLYAFNTNGTLRWSYHTGARGMGAPSIGPDGTIYVAGDLGAIYAITPYGNLKWKLSIEYLRASHMAVRTDNTLYATSSEKLYAIDNNGSIKWSLPLDSGPAYSIIGADGTAYLSSSEYGGSLYAVNSDGTIKWSHKFSHDENLGSPVIGSDGTLFCVAYIANSEGKLYAFGLADSHLISGQVTLAGAGLEGVTMTLSGAVSSSTSTAVDGSYAFTNLPDGSYTITPSLAGYTFNPPSIDITISESDVSGQDFRACDSSVPLSGILRDATTNNPLSGITVTVDGVYSTVTDSNGNYDFSGLSCGDHEIEVDVPLGYSSYIRTMDISLNPTWDIFLTKPETVYGPDTPSGYSQDPVNTATGNYIYNKKDLEIPGTGLAFVFERHYNSQCGEDGPLGFGWNHTYAATLTVNADSSVTIQWGDGKTETWTPDGSGGFTPQYGIFDALIDNGDGTYTVKKRDLTRYNFDASGMLSSVVDKNGNTISMTYTGNDLVQITDTVGRIINLTHDVNGRITQIADPIGRTIQFAYDGNGDLVSSTDMNGNTTTYTYDANHQVLTVVDPRGNTVVTNIYDGQKRVVTSQRDAKGGQTTYAYDEVNKKTTLTDALGYTTIHFHDELLRLIQETDDKSDSAYFTYNEPGNRTEVKNKNANKTTYTYDANGNVLTKTDALGNLTTITYDANNNPLTRTDALSNTTTYEYDANGNLIKATDPLGNLTTMTYNAYGKPLTITDARDNITTNSYDAEGNLIEVTDALGNKTTYTYDGVGRRLTLTNALGKTTAYTYDNNDNFLTVTDPLGNVTTHTYNQNNNRLTTTDPMGNTTTYAHDVKDLLTTTTDPLSNSITNAYDGLDRKTSITDKRGNTTTFSYDAVGNLLTMTDHLGNSTTYSYDANGNQLTNTNPLGHTVTYAYDFLDRQTSATDPLCNSTTTTYDAIGRITAETNAKGQTTSFEYDAMGRLIKVIDDEAGTIIYTYDENGNRLTMKDSNENTTTYTYDALNRLTQKVEPLGSTFRYAYDAVGNMTSMTDANGNSIIYTYDSNNRLIEIKYPDDSKVTFTYDAKGNKIQMVDGLGTTSYTYDALNRMASYADPFGKTVTYGYDANGNRILLTYPDGKIVSYAYDALNRLATVTDWLTRETIYTYDAAGNLIRALNPNNTKVSYAYDAAERLTELSNTKSDFSVISSYVYTLDAIGNHTSVVQNEPLAPILASQNTAYTYDSENRLLEARGTLYSYDANGNLTKKGSDTFTYDYEDRLVQSNIGGTDTQYGYDGLGNRLRKTTGGTTTRYVLDINGSLPNILAETDHTGAITTYYVYGLGLISKVLPDDTTYNYHYDSRGSTVALTDVLQNTTDAYAYDSFGNVANSSGSTQNPFKHVGRYGVMNEENGLNYIRARYYSPEVGRFITKDPQTGNDRDGQSLNRYLYALNNPVVLIDISGFSAQEGGVDRNNQQSSDEIHKQILDEYQQNLIDEYLQDLIIALGGDFGKDFAEQLQLYALKYGDLNLGTGTLDVGGLGYVLEKGFNFLTLAKLAKGFGTELGTNWDNPNMHWTEKWGRATMGMTVHSTLSAINIMTGGLVATSLTTGAGIAYDENIDRAWNWLQSSKGINWLGGGFYHLGLY